MSLLVHRLANTLACERRCIRSRFVALLHHTQRDASVARLAGAAHRRSRCDTVFMKRSTKVRVKPFRVPGILAALWFVVAAPLSLAETSLGSQAPVVDKVSF